MTTGLRIDELTARAYGSLTGDELVYAEDTTGSASPASDLKVTVGALTQVNADTDTFAGDGAVGGTALALADGGVAAPKLAAGIVIAGSGIVVTRDPTTGVITIATGSQPHHEGSRYTAVSEDISFSVAEVTGGNEYDTSQDNMAFPTYTGNRYIGILQPAAQTDIVGITFEGADQFTAFTKIAAAVTINSVSYEMWRTIAKQTDYLSGDPVTVRT